MRRLIVNADDFGLTPGVNRAILEAYRGGIVTSATLMANAGATEDAVRAQASAPALDLGCHVVLVDGAPVGAPREARSLSPRDGRFRDRLGSLARAALTGRIDAAEVEAEASAQIRKLQAMGARLTHFDTHKHTHVFPAIFRPLLRAAAACGIRAARTPFEPVAALAAQRRQWGQLTRLLPVLTLAPLCRAFRRAAAEAGLVTPDGTLGIVATGSLDSSLFAELVAAMPEGTWELVCHPGYDDADLAGARTRLRSSRTVELALLTSGEARRALENRGVELISYRDLL